MAGTRVLSGPAAEEYIQERVKESVEHGIAADIAEAFARIFLAARNGVVERTSGVDEQTPSRLP